jgi:hypothetical protein
MNFHVVAAEEPGEMPCRGEFEHDRQDDEGAQDEPDRHPFVYQSSGPRKPIASDVVKPQRAQAEERQLFSKEVPAD